MNGPEQSDFAAVQRVVPHYLMRSIEVQLMDGTVLDDQSRRRDRHARLSLLHCATVKPQVVV